MNYNFTYTWIAIICSLFTCHSRYSSQGLLHFLCWDWLSNRLENSIEIYLYKAVYICIKLCNFYVIKIVRRKRCFLSNYKIAAISIMYMMKLSEIFRQISLSTNNILIIIGIPSVYFPLTPLFAWHDNPHRTKICNFYK